MIHLKQCSDERNGPSPSLEDWLAELLGLSNLRVALEFGGDRCSRRRAAFGALGLGAPLLRSDEERIVRGGLRASVAHCKNVCLGVAAPVAVACDLTDTGPADRELPLSPPDRCLAQAVADHSGESMARATLRVRSARVCLRKLGVRYAGNLLMRLHDHHDAVVLAGAGATIASIVTSEAGLISVSCVEPDGLA